MEGSNGCLTRTAGKPDETTVTTPHQVQMRKRGLCNDFIRNLCPKDVCSETAKHYIIKASNFVTSAKSIMFIILNASLRKFTQTAATNK